MKENKTTVNNLSLDIKVASEDGEKYTLENMLYRIEALEEKINNITFFLNNPRKLNHYE